jgi:hypothetical protein
MDAPGTVPESINCHECNAPIDLAGQQAFTQVECAHHNHRSEKEILLSGRSRPDRAHPTNCRNDGSFFAPLSNTSGSTAFAQSGQTFALAGAGCYSGGGKEAGDEMAVGGIAVDAGGVRDV